MKKGVPLLIQKSSLIQLQNENLTMLSYQIESLSSKSQLRSLFYPSFITRARMQTRNHKQDEQDKTNKMNASNTACSAPYY